ncbi:hypothetical protein ABT275_33695 [Streptomyces sp. NPDC001185]|uniref:hypothetical protein n=1 Tax=Streptomyces sp. NPDC001185 TaxID=3154380 RepID=UPI003328064C
MPAPHALIDAVARRFGRRRAYTDTTEIDALLTEQTNFVYSQAPDPADLAAARHSELAVQPLLMDVRGRALADFVYLEAVLADARSRRLAPELIRSLRTVVGHSRELTGLLADAVRTTTVPTTTEDASSR